MTDAETLQRVLRFAASHGVKTHLVALEKLASLAAQRKLIEAPFAIGELGIAWKAKHLYYTRKAVGLHKLLAERLAVAKELGLLDDQDRPVAIR